MFTQLTEPKTESIANVAIWKGASVPRSQESYAWTACENLGLGGYQTLVT